MPVKSNVPIRICGSKTRTGCRTCKQRHVKCDENLPTCLRCQKANRQCVFDQLVTKSPQSAGSPSHPRGKRISNHPQYAAFLQLPHLYEGISPSGPRDLAEVNAVGYFVAYQGKELAGCFSDDIWCLVLPRVAQHEPAVWHAMAAVSMLDTSMRYDYARQGQTTSDRSMAIRQYGKAMQILNEHMGHDATPYSKNVVLLCCILFAIFECLQNRFEPALRHISGGTKLLVEWASEARSRKDKVTDGYLDYTGLQPIFLALDSQAVQMGANSFETSAFALSANDLLQIPDRFLTVNDAHSQLTHIFNRISHWADSNGRHAGVEGGASAEGHPPHDEWSKTESRRLRTKLIEWDFAFYHFRSMQQQNQQQQPAIVLLLVQRNATQVFFERQLGDRSEMEWDKHVTLFEELVEHAEEYMNLVKMEQPQCCAGDRNLQPQPPPRRPVFTAATDIVLPLFLVSAKCRDSKIRRRALAMLKSCDRKEGIWDSYLTAQVAEKIIALEEQNALPNGHIPESARIFELDVQFSDDAASSITHKKLVIEEDGSQSFETVEDNLSW